MRFVSPEPRRAGIVDTKSRQVETEDALRRRVQDATRYRDIDRLAISLQCGFSSAVGSGDAMDVQWRKTEVRCRVADRIWPRPTRPTGAGCSG
ncbi:MAG: hypothetical protein JOZ07_14965 [Solirubrobacterales bacterium]|nr:hypothetical protein [Solirubrobacterales bacterium]